jgi:TPR repeat protein
VTRGLPFELVPRDAERARMIDLAGAGDHDAAVIAASMLFAGEGGPVDVALALALVRNAADAGDPDAMLMLGGMLWITPGDERDGFGWLRRAAATGHIAASYYVGLAYARGQGIDRDLSLARRHLSLAAAAGHADAARELAALVVP